MVGDSLEGLQAHQAHVHQALVELLGGHSPAAGPAMPGSTTRGKVRSETKFAGTTTAHGSHSIENVLVSRTHHRMGVLQTSRVVQVVS